MVMSDSFSNINIEVYKTEMEARKTMLESLDKKQSIQLQYCENSINDCTFVDIQGCYARFDDEENGNCNVYVHLLDIDTITEN